MKIIGIDPSITSTAMVVNNDGDVKCYCFSKKYPKLWSDRFKTAIKVLNLTHLKTPKNYSDGEIIKYTNYNSLAYIVADESGAEKGDLVCVEGYSYGSIGKTIDIVTYGTLLRHYLITRGSELKFIAPQSLKKSFGEVVYGSSKKGVVENKDGVKGGNFTKTDMLKVVLELDNDDEFTKLCKKYSNVLLKRKKVPKPIEDVIDAYAAMCILKKEYENGNN